MKPTPPKPASPLGRRIGALETRKLHAQHDQKKGVWYGLGMFGMIGWSVAVPVLVGTAAARGVDGPLVAWRAVAAGIVALALQVATNYANDYSDGIRGTDADRVGPVRLVGGGLATPLLVKYAAFTCFGLACLAGLALIPLIAFNVLQILVIAIVVGVAALKVGEKAAKTGEVC